MLSTFRSTLSHVIITDENGRETVFHLCSKSHVKSISEWAESLDESNFKKVRDIFFDGLAENTKELAFQLSKGMFEHPLKDSELMIVLRWLRDSLGHGSETDTIHIEM